jgi:hypothetical protein
MTTRTLAPLLLVCLGACATTSYRAEPAPTVRTEPTARPAPPSHSGMLAMPPADRDKEPGAPDDLSLPTGAGLTFGPTTFLVGTTLDIPVDTKITFGPSLQYGIDEHVDLLMLTGQLKYFLPVVRKDESTFSMLPYVTGGLGFVRIDKEGTSSDSGLGINAGVGVRFLSGKHYRIGSEARLILLPDEISGEELLLSLELLQIVITF